MQAVIYVKFITTSSITWPIIPFSAEPVAISDKGAVNNSWVTRKPYNIVSSVGPT